MRRAVVAGVVAGLFSSSACAGLMWQAGIDQAAQNAAAWVAGWQSKVAGVVWQMGSSGNTVTVSRVPGQVATSTLPVPTGSSIALRPASPAGFAPGAIIDVPARVTVPGRSSQLPVTVLEPIAKRSLAKALIKSLPILGTAYSLGELLDEIGASLRDGQIVEDVSVDSSQYYTVGTRPYLILGYTAYRPPLPYSLDKVASCKWFSENYYPGRPWWVSNDLCYINWIPSQTVSYQIVPDNHSSPPCTPGSYYYQGQCYLSVPTTEKPISEEELISRVEALPEEVIVNHTNQSLGDPRVIDVVAREIADDEPDPRFALPSPSGTVQVGDPVTSTETSSDGRTKTTTTTTTATANGNKIEFITKTETVIRDAAGNVIDSTTTTTTPTDPSNPNSPSQQIVTCGLPDTPPCKIDETGTPQAPSDDGQSAFRSLLPACLQNDWKSCIPQLPDINWSFSLPSGCSPIPVPFERYGLSHINVCQYQPVIHDLMSMLWAGAGLFAAIGILSGRRVTED